MYYIKFHDIETEAKSRCSYWNYALYVTVKRICQSSLQWTSYSFLSYTCIPGKLISWLSAHAQTKDNYQFWSDHLGKFDKWCKEFLHPNSLSQCTFMTLKTCTHSFSYTRNYVIDTNKLHRSRSAWNQQSHDKSSCPYTSEITNDQPTMKQFHILFQIN